MVAVPDEEILRYFKSWKKALEKWNERGEIEFRSLSFGQDDAFDIFNNGDLEISVLGPFLTEK